MKILSKMIEPIGDHLVVIPDDENKIRSQTKSKILVPDRFKKEVFQGQVLTVGPGEEARKKFLPGQTVIYSQDAGAPIRCTDGTVLVLDIRDVLAIS